MTKVKAKGPLFPVPICIVGTMVNGKINYSTYGSFGLLAPVPKTYVYIGSQESRYTNIGIRETGYFSVNIPSSSLMQKTDYVGLVSGRKNDKSAVFKSFFGSVDKAPMIEECPINMLCSLVKTVELPDRAIFCGEVVEAFVDEHCQQDGKLDFAKIDPLLLTLSAPGDASYRKLGEVVGRAYKEGLALMPKGPKA